MVGLCTIVLSTILTFVSVSAKSNIIGCYYGTWATYRNGLGKFDVSNINVDLCTHLIYTFVGIDNNGNIQSLDPYLDLADNWGRDNIRKFNALKEKKPNLKTILAVGGWNEGSAKFSVMAASSTLRRNFITSALDFVLSYGFDGLDVDWEYPNRRDSVNGQADIDNFTQLLKEIRAEFDKYGLLLSSAVASVKAMASLSYDIPAISQYLDLINVMAYDMYGPWDPVTGHNAPLHKGEGDENEPKENLYTVDVALQYWLSQGCPPEKLVLGLPLYGHTFKLANPSVNGVRSPVNGPGIAGPYTATNGQIGYNEFCDKLRTETWDLRYDSLAKVPYAVQGQNWVSYDDTNSLVDKIEYALKLNIGGFMVWSIETDDFHGLCHSVDFPLLRAINQAVGMTPVSSTSTSTPTITNSSPTTTSSPTVSEATSTTASSSSATEATEIPFVCKEEGLTANPQDCTSFHICVRSVTGFDQYTQYCPTNLHWDESNKICNYPELVNCNTEN